MASNMANVDAMPSSWGILVYRDLTSMVTRRASGGKGGRERTIWRKCVVFLIYDGMVVVRGWRKWSTKAESLSVGESQPEMIGRPGVPSLWIFGRM